MSETYAIRTLNRILAVPWRDDSYVVAHSSSRARLMAEYLRRVTLWADALEVERNPVNGWPFFDVTDRVAPPVHLDPEILARLDEARIEIYGQWVRPLALAALHWAALLDAGSRPLPELPDPYEPILLLFERGGGFWMVNGMADLGLSMVPLRDQQFWKAEDVRDLSPAALDTLDAEEKERLRVVIAKHAAGRTD